METIQKINGSQGPSLANSQSGIYKSEPSDKQRDNSQGPLGDRPSVVGANMMRTDRSYHQYPSQTSPSRTSVLTSGGTRKPSQQKLNTSAANYSSATKISPANILRPHTRADHSPGSRGSVEKAAPEARQKVSHNIYVPKPDQSSAVSKLLRKDERSNLPLTSPSLAKPNRSSTPNTRETLKARLAPAAEDKTTKDIKDLANTSLKKPTTGLTKTLISKYKTDIPPPSALERKSPKISGRK